MNGFYDKEMTNDNDNYIKYFKNNKIDINESSISTKLVQGNDNNFNFICQNDNNLESVENQIKEKIEEISNTYKSFDESYSTKNIIVPI